MPIVERSTYSAPRWLVNGHMQTIYPAMVRRVPAVPFCRYRIDTPDDDFILVDRITALPSPAKNAVILSHGLEGNSRRTYMRGMARAFLDLGWDCISRNFRACSGEVNKTKGMYHSGQTEDLHLTVKHAISLGYTGIFLVGFSMGGNQTLKYLGENADHVPPEVMGAAVFSTPCDLVGCSVELAKPGNAIYMEYFMRTLRRKVVRKNKQYPDLYPLENLEKMRTFKEFDDQYTAPVHGFSSAEDYWTKASCLPFLQGIKKPTLVVNADNDPFLSASCYPVYAAKNSDHLFLEITKGGGHVGFASKLREEAYWSEKRACEFALNLCP